MVLLLETAIRYVCLVFLYKCCHTIDIINNTICMDQNMVSVPVVMGKWKASKLIVSESWAILKQDKEMMLFPIMSTISSLVAFVVLEILYFFVLPKGLESESFNATVYGTLFIYYVVMFFILNFFQAGIYIIAHGRFSGKDLSFKDGINGALNSAGKIFIWSVISSTVGILLNIIANKFKFIGVIIANICGAAWNIMTYFSLPSLVIGNKTISESFKDSASMIRKTWGETIIINFGVSLIFAGLMFLGLALSIGIIVLAPSLFVFLSVLALYVVYIIILSIISSTLGSIFKLALYEYASTGVMPAGFTPEVIRGAIQRK